MITITCHQKSPITILITLYIFNYDYQDYNYDYINNISRLQVIKIISEICIINNDIL